MGRGSSYKRRAEIASARREPAIHASEPVRSEVPSAISVSHVSQMSYQGPIPPAHMLEEYEAVVPGSAKQIIDIFVEQARHRMRMEAGVTEGATKRAWFGLWCGFSLGIIGLLFGSILVALNHDTAGALLAGGSLVSLVGVFVFGTNSQRRERLEKQKQSQPNR